MNVEDLEKDKAVSPTMPVEAVVSFYEQMAGDGITIWLDGGWGVDALLGEQTRPHGDLDIAIQGKDIDKMRQLLEADGFSDVPRDDTRDWNFVLGNKDGREIDVHVINIDENGDGIYGPPENGEKYPASALTGHGILNGVPVKCVSAEDAVKFHTGYAVDADDYHDVKALCERFDIPLPQEYEKFE